MEQDQLHDTELEKITLCDALISKSARLKVITELHEGDFYSEVHKVLFSVIQDMTIQDKEIDMALLTQELKGRNTKSGQSELEAVGGLPFLTQVYNSSPSAANVAAHIAKMKNLSDRRNLLSELAIMQTKAADLSVDDDKVASLYQNIRAITGKPVEVKKEHMQTAKAAYMDVFAELSEQANNPENKQNGIKTGLRDIDRCIGSMKPNSLIIIAGRPANGKSALALTIAINAAKAGKRVLFCGLEMSNGETVKRALARDAKVNGNALYNPETMTQKDWNSIVKEGDSFAELPIVFDDSTRLSPLDVKQKARDFKRVTGAPVDLIVIDYLGLMTAGMRKENRVQEVSYITRSLKNLASELEIPILLLSQLNRANERENRPPKLSDLRESGSIEQDASGVILISRDTRSTDGNKSVEYQNTATLDIAKWRNGKPQKVKVTFLPQYFCFMDYSAREEVTAPVIKPRGNTQQNLWRA